ncbi:unnamed protein product [Camellia sinensis]
MFNGTWVPYSNGPYYTNETECLIDDRQNCMKFGRLDTEFLKWRWKPDDCELPMFEGAEFLEIVRGKSMAFIGDSLSRNQIESLVCLLASVARPVNVSNVQDIRFKHWLYLEYNFTLSILWTTHLVRASDLDPTGDSHKSPMNLHLDQVDLAWASHIQDYDYLIISVGQWFSIPLIYYHNNQVIGCHKCNIKNVTKMSQYYGFRMAHQTAFKTLLNRPKGTMGIVFLRTISPAHFENGEWNTGGYCVRTRPFRRREKKVEGYIREFYEAQIGEFWEAKREGRERGLKFRLLDTTEAMAMRPDGHPNYNGQSPRGNVSVADCVHWCLPGPIDTWNELLLQMLKRERAESSDSKLLCLPSWKNSRNSSKNAKLFILIFVLLTIISICPHKNSHFLRIPQEIDTNIVKQLYPEINANDTMRIKKISKKCDMFKGDWVPYPEGPYYTNETKCLMDNRQNCMKFGRPDTEFMKWRWKPDECELPLFDSARFLELVRGKAMAFIGDSVARNHLQSLVCLLTSVTRPLDIAVVLESSERWFYTDYNFTIAHLWTTHLVQASQGIEPYNKVPSNLTLDKPDETWSAEIENFDFVIISAEHWFLRPLTYYENGKFVGCHICSKQNNTYFDVYYAYRTAFRTSFNTLLTKFKGITFLRTITGTHVNHKKKWSEDGDCERTRPFSRHEAKLDEVVLKLYSIQLDEFRVAERKGRKKGLRFRVLNVTEPMTMRPDGHPNRYGHWPHEKVRRPDCLHWCLPGPIDVWNEMLLQMIEMENER